MNATTLTARPLRPFDLASSEPRPAAVGRLPGAARFVLDVADAMTSGSLLWQLPDGQLHRSGNRCPGGVEGVLRVHDFAVFERIAATGDIGFAEAYLDGTLDCDDLSSVLSLLARNRPALGRVLYGRGLRLLGYRLRHALRANTRAGSRRNILAHYDLGNDFYRHWLDDSMTYSSGLFAHGTGSLEWAQAAKYRRILDTLQVRPGDEILEVGCGWGGFAEIAARDYGARVHGITLSPAQLAYAQARIAAAGVADRVTLELRDYRDLVQLGRRFSHIVSIEMFEAVGQARWPRFFAALRGCLAPGAHAVVQTITIDPALFDRYCRGTDFIQQYIFPGGMLPSLPLFGRTAGSQGLTMLDVLDFGPDYARTLAIWRQRFDTAWPHIAAQGFDDRFRRLWHFYLAYCEAGFAAGATSVVQVTLGQCPPGKGCAVPGWPAAVLTPPG